MKRHKGQAIVLRRTNYSDADRVLNLLTDKFGRLSVLARGVRKSGARMAAGVEPFTISDIEFISGKGELSTLVSARPDKYFKNLIKHYQRSVVAGEMLRLMNELIEDDVDENFFVLGRELLYVLDDMLIDVTVAETWFRLQLLGLLGRQPNLLNDAKGNKLNADNIYHFDTSEGVFLLSQQGNFGGDNIKAWRVLSLKSPRGTKNIKGLTEATAPVLSFLTLFMADNSF